jgi:hypothetical protein
MNQFLQILDIHSLARYKSRRMEGLTEVRAYTHDQHRLLLSLFLSQLPLAL